MPRANIGGITHVPTARRALTGVLAITVAGIAAAGPANDSSASDRAVVPAIAAAADTTSADRPIRLAGLRTGIHATVHTGVKPGKEVRKLERTAGRSVRRAGRKARPSLTRRTATIRQERLAGRQERVAYRQERAAVPRARVSEERIDRVVRKVHKKRKARDAYRTRKAGLRQHVKARNGARATGELGQVLDYALDQVGKPYRANAAGPGSYDCSGLVSVAYRKAGVKLPHSSHAIVRKGKRVRRADLRPGDVVMPQSGHVGIYLGDGKIVHAATPSSGVVVSKMYGFSTARRML
ncbi:C40 family peptidase [Catenuloplanes sp. NPDC051500]|uniref:C40 family peptidase n=1 Tax=Catenuloplanes sp. NPDC051500 TaxID=3363959 RepID=UPI0037AC1238